jgi:NAD-dependent dihydropyrimidine dehydrogenase PreA subunit
MTNATRSPAREKSLRKLAGMMNTRHRIPFPLTGPLLDCFDIALTPEETDFCLRMGTAPFTCGAIPSRSGLPDPQANQLFQGLMRKGFFWPQPAAGAEEVFALSGIMLGWFEIFLSDGGATPVKREFARRLDLLFKSWGSFNRFPMRGLMNYRIKHHQPAQTIVAITDADSLPNRTIAVDRTVEPAPMKIYPAHTVLQLIEKHGNANSIAVVHCFCRHYHKLVGESCRFQMPPESCLAIGSLAQHAVRSGVGRLLSKMEATALVGELQKKGAVHQVFHEEENPHNPEIAICNCCWDCCGVFGSYNRAYIPLHLKSYFEARMMDSSACSGCASCVDHCPVQAVALISSKAQIQESKCIGCGQCELQCPEGAIRLIPHERNVILPLEKKSGARIAG